MPLIRSSPITPPSSQSGAETIERDLEHGTSDQRWDAARAAAQLADGLRVLRRALSIERDPRIREAILTSLARIGTPECAEAVLRDLRSDDSRLRAAALDALRAMPAAAAVHLPRLLRDTDPDVRLLACDLVRGQSAVAAGQLLGDVLTQDHEANVCAAAVEVLAETGGPDVLLLLERCAARFPGDPFLAFAIRVAVERLGAQR